MATTDWFGRSGVTLLSEGNDASSSGLVCAALKQALAQDCRVRRPGCLQALLHWDRERMLLRGHGLAQQLARCRIALSVTGACTEHSTANNPAFQAIAAHIGRIRSGRAACVGDAGDRGNTQAALQAGDAKDGAH